MTRKKQYAKACRKVNKIWNMVIRNPEIADRANYSVAVLTRLHKAERAGVKIGISKEKTRQIIRRKRQYGYTSTIRYRGTQGHISYYW